MFNIDFEPIGRRGNCAREQSLLDCARQLSVDIVSICGGVGSCGRCRMQIVSGKVTRLALEEEAELSLREIQGGYRLACLTFPLSDVKVHIPPESLTAIQRTQVEGLEVIVTPDPAIRSQEASLVIPSLQAPIADDANLWSALGLPVGTIDFQLQQRLSDMLRELNWNPAVALRGSEIIALAPAGTQWLGLAVDIGTTKIAGYLVDLESGKTLASRGMMNPQIAYGEDVVTRIATASRSPADAARLQSLLVEALTQTAWDLTNQVGANPENIADMVVVGNTAIHHLFLRLPVKQLGLAPYVPAMRSAIDIKAREIGLRLAPGAYVHLLPNIAGYVGADHVAMLLATRLVEADRTTLAIDIGTNTEICLNYQGRIASLSCASGPAFEGAHIKFGMRAAPGAIEHVRLVGEKLEIQTIGGEPPVGICGSGLLDAVAQLRLNHILDHRGRMSGHARLQNTHGVNEFVLAERPGQEPITLTQKDVRELQLAKAAIRLGIQALVAEAGITESDIQQVIIAGAFGTFIDVKSAVTIGMLPDLPLERFSQVGNAAGTGARLALVSLAQRREAGRIAGLDGYLELAAVPDFNRKFADATFI